MKRLLTALAILASFAFGTPSIALAAPLCTPYTGGNDTTNWPLGVYFQVCGTDVNTNSASFVGAAFNSIPNPSTISTAGYDLKLAMIDLYAHGAVVNTGQPAQGAGRYGVVYIFHTYAEWKSFATAAEIAAADPGKTAGAVTVSTGDGQALYTAIWEVNGVGIDNGWVGGKNILAQEVGHEFGHWVDFLMSVVGGGSHVLSNSPMFVREWNQDIANINLSTVYMCGPLGNNPLAYGKADNTATTANGKAPYFICDGTKTQGSGYVYGAASNGLGPNLNTGYTGLSNLAVLQKAWPYFYKPGASGSAEIYEEIFSEIFGTNFEGGDGARNPVQADWYYNNRSAIPTSFTCTYQWINWVASHGSLPNAGNNSFPAGAGCPTN